MILRSASPRDPEMLARLAQPKVYRLTSARLRAGKPLKFFTFGCQGKSKNQEKVAQLMNELAANPDNRPDFFLDLGDNFYDNGVASSDDPAFGKLFYQMYRDPKKTPNIARVPHFPILGNHDEDYQNWGSGSEQGPQRGLHQVAHTYETNESGSTAAKIATYHSEDPNQETVLDLDTIQGWNMPSRAYSLLHGNDQIFCIDSNTYVKDFIEYTLHGDNTEPSNQVRFLVEEYRKARAAGRNIMLAMHHPLVTPGKRAYERDSKLYLKQDEMTPAMAKIAEELFPGLFSEGFPYCNMLKAVFTRQGMIFDTVFTAHDHDIYVYNNLAGENPKPDHYPICQVTSGGGGGSVQNQKSFRDPQNMGCFLREHGVVQVTCGKPTRFSIHTLELKRHFEFDNRSPEPNRQYGHELQHEMGKTERFASMIRSGIIRYFDFLGIKQDEHTGSFFWMNTSHGTAGADRASAIWNYLAQAEPDCYIETIKKVCDCAMEPRFRDPSVNSMITHLDKVCREEYGRSLAELRNHEYRVHRMAQTQEAYQNSGL